MSAAGDNRYLHSPATSDGAGGSVSLGTGSLFSSVLSGTAPHLIMFGVATSPGTTVFTQMLCSAHMKERLFVRLITPALAAE